MPAASSGDWLKWLPHNEHRRACDGHATLSRRPSIALGEVLGRGPFDRCGARCTRISSSSSMARNQGSVIEAGPRVTLLTVGHDREPAGRCGCDDGDRFTVRTEDR